MATALHFPEHDLRALREPPLDDWRARGTQRLLALGWLAGVALSPRLWLSDRAYPLTPVSDFWPTIPPPLDLVLFGGLVLALLAMLVWPRPKGTKWVLASVLGLALVLALGDQSRWQPWAYQYFWMTFALFWYPWRDSQGAAPSQRSIPLHACRLILAGIYFWSGCSKCNHNFRESVFPWLFGPLLDLLSPEAAEFARQYLSYAVGPLEALIGFGLLVPSLRIPSVIFAVVMHVGILWVLGPFNHCWNTIVWPWNVVMPALVIVLFWRVDDVSFLELTWPRWRAGHCALLVLFWILPALHGWGYWDSYLSACLYSGNTAEASVRFGWPSLLHLPEDVQKQATSVGGDEYDLLLTTWSFTELNVPAYPAQRVFLHIGRVWHERVPEDESLRLTIQGQRRMADGRRTRRVYETQDLK